MVSLVARALTIITLIGVVIVVPMARVARAQYDGVACARSIDPGEVSVNASTTIHVTYTNLGSDPISWIQISHNADPANLTFESATSGDWSTQVNSTSVTLIGSSLSPGDTMTIDIGAAGGAGATTALIDAMASSSGDGSGSIQCFNETNFTVVSDNTPPSISDVTVSGETASEATVTWTTDELANSHVDYGSGTDYGNSADDGTYTTSHTVTISGLDPAHTYNYRVSSSDRSNNTSSWSNATFSTIMGPTSTPGPTPTPDIRTTTVTVTSPSSASTTQSTSSSAPRDTVRPTAALHTKLLKSYKVAPLLEGHASDNLGVSRVEYSTDGGLNWLPVEHISSTGRGSVKYDFTPVLTEDGNYDIRIQATDTSGNIGRSDTYTIVIDRLVPGIGLHELSVGQMLLTPQHGVYDTTTQVVHMVHISAVGGPTHITLNISGAHTESTTSELVQATDRGLWSGELKFGRPDLYTVTATSVDGVGNSSTQYLTTIRAREPGHVVDQLSHPVAHARVAVYVFDSVTQQYQLWDAESYSQANPALATIDGDYAYVLPQGRYYMMATAAGYRTLKTSIFDISETTVYNPRLVMETGHNLQVGPLVVPLDWTVTYQRVTLEAQFTDIHDLGLSGKIFPNVDLMHEGQLYATSSLRGEPTVVGVFNTWMPEAAEYMAQLDTLSSHGVHVAVIIPHESDQSVAMYARRGDYHITMVADPDGLLITKLGITDPSYLILTRRGIIKNVLTGQYTSEQLSDQLVD